MNYINTVTFEYPFTERDIRNLNPNTSFSNPFVPPDEYQIVFSAPQPQYNAVTQTVREIQPVYTTKGTWEQKFEVVTKFQEYADEEGFVRTVAEQEAAAISASLSQNKADKWEAIKSYRNNLTQAGGYKVSTKWFHSDTFSRSQQLGLVLMGANIPQGLQWKTMDGTFVQMTPTLAQQVFQAAALQDSAVFTQAEVLNASVQALGTVAEVQSFDITVGWPETYQE